MFHLLGACLAAGASLVRNAGSECGVGKVVLTIVVDDQVIPVDMHKKYEVKTG